MTRHAITRRLLLGALASVFALGGIAARAAEPEVLRIGYQKYGTLTLLKARGTLDKRLAAEGVSVKWTEFPAGPQLLEGLNVGSIDFGTVGEAPPIFAQAAGADIVYVANEPPSPESEAIVVPKDSPLRTVRDLKGKRVAFNKGSNVHYLLVKLLEQAGLAYKDVEPVFLTPADARAAFERKAVDAWVIWDPYLASAQTQLAARILADGRGVVANHQFYLAARPFAERKPEQVRAIIEELEKVDAWGRANPEEVVKVLAPAIALDEQTTLIAARRYSYGVTPVTLRVLDVQQKIADTFTELKLIPRRLVVRDAAPRELSVAHR